MPRWLLAALLLVPLSGCVGGNNAAAIDAFVLVGALADDPTPLPLPGCDVLHDLLTARAREEARASLQQSVEQTWYYAQAIDVLADATAATGASASAAEGAAPRDSDGDGRQATGTNNQEGAADEGDFLKTDGQWTYILRDGQLHVLRHPAVGDLVEVATIQLDSGQPYYYGGQGFLLLEPRDGDDPTDDRLVVVLANVRPDEEGIAMLAPSLQPRANGLTRIAVLDLADRSQPAVVSDTYVEGYPTGVRLVDGVAHVVVQANAPGLDLTYWAEPSEGDLRVLGFLPWMDRAPDEGEYRAARQAAANRADAANAEKLGSLPLRAHVPLILSATGGGMALPEPLGDKQCRDVLAVPGPTGRSFSTILSIDTAGDLEVKTLQVLAPSAVVYASGDALVLAAPSADAWWAGPQQAAETVDLHWFDIDGTKVAHRASGRVAGSILDAFAIDVHDGRLRVATTLNTWRWVASEPMVSQVVVLKPVQGVLVPTGLVGGLAPTERIWSVRFTDDRAYVVTFRNMDPLWIIDLSGDVPQLLGEFEMPGVSTYLHPIDDDTLLSIGYGSSDGVNIDRGLVEVSLFDLSDPANPVRAAKLALNPGGSGGSGHSLAIDEHKAFTYWPAVGRLAVPVSTWDSYGYQPTDELRLVAVDPDARTLRAAGSLNQSTLPSDINGSSWGYSGGIERSFFLGSPPDGPVSVYTVSARGVTSHDLRTLLPQDGVGFPQTQPMYYVID